MSVPGYSIDLIPVKNMLKDTHNNCLVTCGKVISQQAEDPFCEDTGGEQVVAVVIHCKLGFHLRVQIHREIGDTYISIGQNALATDEIRNLWPNYSK